VQHIRVTDAKPARRACLDVVVKSTCAVSFFSQSQERGMVSQPSGQELVRESKIPCNTYVLPMLSRRAWMDVVVKSTCAVSFFSQSQAIFAWYPG
jgi:hypothetical protein